MEEISAEVLSLTSDGASLAFSEPDTGRSLDEDEDNATALVLEEGVLELDAEESGQESIPDDE